ncbi:MAG: hypothetical protein RDU89_02960 [bacterium]|nr:hypothetical protein [bacterium]
MAGRTIGLVLEANYDAKSGRPRLLGHVVGLPGCVVKADDEAALLHKTPEAVRAYLKWLISAGEEVPAGWAVLAGSAVEVVARFDRSTVREPMLPGDQVEVSRDDLALLLRRLEQSRNELKRLLAESPHLQTPSEKWTGPGWPPGRVVAHIGEAEMWYWHQLLGDEVIVPFLDAIRRQTCELAAQALSHPPAPPAVGQTGWSLRKVLRRCLEHEQEHLDQLRRLAGTGDAVPAG